MTALPSQPSSLKSPLRRQWLQGAAAAAALSPLALAFGARAQAGVTPSRAPGYGPLRPVADGTTGLPLLMLPEGFSYRSFGWVTEPLSNGGAIPGAADGMGIVAVQGEVFTLVRNHELRAFSGGFGPVSSHYDAPCSGGTVTLRYDRAKGQMLEARGSLSGTLVNCAGGTTPWGSWLSCEEIVTPAGERVTSRGERLTLEKPHGFVFEVPGDGASNAQPLVAMGQFKHEAAVVDPVDGTVYLTEDNRPAGFYRLLPTQRGKLAAGGRLQMLRAKQRPDLRTGLQTGQRWDVDWVDIERPEQGQSATGVDGVLRQGAAQGGSLFTRLEGVWVQGDEVWFTSTDGGDARAGQIWRLRPSQQTLELFYESTSASVLDYPDNICLSPSGAIVLCEDSKQPVQRLFGMTREGGLFELARNNAVFKGELPGLTGDFRRAEWAGACFSPDGRTLFANVYSPGFSVAITGPFA
ncbi:MAG: alkaline phosphatase PhoX [Burkholderiales bacterium]|jgi:secreted PhoX family phosphatase